MSTTLIYGAGAIGQWLGTLLNRQGIPVHLHGRPAVREALEERGGISFDDSPPWPVPFTSEPSELAGRTFHTVIVTVKTFAVKAALGELAEHDLDFEHLVAFQNGWGTEELYWGRFPQKTLWALTTTRAVGSDGPGRLFPASTGGLAVAPWLHRAGPLEIPFPLRRVPLPLVYVKKGPELRWSKLLLNLIGNATGAVVGLPPSKLADHRDLMSCEIRLIREALSVGHALGLNRQDLPGFSVRTLSKAAEKLPLQVIRPIIAAKMRKARGDKLPSFFFDLENPNQPSEIVHLNGAVVKEGRRLGVPTPLQTKLVQVFEQCRQEPETWAKFRQDPALLGEELS